MAAVETLAAKLNQHGIRPSAQRLAIGAYVLETGEHPSAERVWSQVRPQLPMVSRATVYNTLNLFVQRGLLRELQLTPGPVVYDANLAPHHHLIDEATGAITDVPWQALTVEGIEALDAVEVQQHSVVLRGRRRSQAQG